MIIIIVVQRHVYYCHLIVIFLSGWLNFYGEYWLNLGTINNYYYYNNYYDDTQKKWVTSYWALEKGIKNTALITSVTKIPSVYESS